MSACTTTTTHCENCGSTEYVTRGGYSGCCNELQATQADCRGFHVEAQAHRARLLYCAKCWDEFDPEYKTAAADHAARCDGTPVKSYPAA